MNQIVDFFCCKRFVMCIVFIIVLSGGGYVCQALFAHSSEVVGSEVTVPVDVADSYKRPVWASADGEDQYGRWASFSVNDVVVKMRFVKAGSFIMGQEGDRFAVPHPVLLTQDYWMAETETTQALWEGLMPENPSSVRNELHPVYRVSWFDCQEFFKKINDVVPGLSARFPTEAQWEYACRAGSTSLYYWGDDSSEETAKRHMWYEKNADGSMWTNPHAQTTGEQPVRMTLPNAWGLYDMSGNIGEWCQDWAGNYAQGCLVDPQGIKQDANEWYQRIHRGGGWDFDVSNNRSSARGSSAPDDGENYLIGFRFVVAAPDNSAAKSVVYSSKTLRIVQEVVSVAVPKIFEDIKERIIADERNRREQNRLAERRVLAKKKNKAQARRRRTEDLERFGPILFKTIESRYYAANGEEDRAARLKKRLEFVEEFPESNRAGCTVQYLGQMIPGDERVAYFEKAIEEYSDSWYGDGVEVGAYARFYLAHHYLKNGKKAMADKLFQELQDLYPDAIRHNGRLISPDAENVVSANN